MNNNLLIVGTSIQIHHQESIYQIHGNSKIHQKKIKKKRNKNKLED
jgi:hypothetical protein